MTYVVPYWSPSRLACYDQCPAEYYQRYVLAMPIEPNTPMFFGTAVHKGLEAHFSGADGELAFRRSWRGLIPDLRAAGCVVPAALFETGLDMIDKVAALELSGIPERKILTDTSPYLTAPLLGYVDLWCEETDTLVDFKTSIGSWSVERAEREHWQPEIYSMAYWLERDVLPKFEYIVLNRATGDLQRFVTQRSEKQIGKMLGRAREIALAIAAGQWACSCGKHTIKEAA